jgi:hypothetical protein
MTRGPGIGKILDLDYITIAIYLEEITITDCEERSGRGIADADVATI